MDYLAFLALLCVLTAIQQWSLLSLLPVSTKGLLKLVFISSFPLVFRIVLLWGVISPQAYDLCEYLSKTLSAIVTLCPAFLCDCVFEADNSSTVNLGYHSSYWHVNDAGEGVAAIGNVLAVVARYSRLGVGEYRERGTGYKNSARVP
jgi:hypothetical protein